MSIAEKLQTVYNNNEQLYEIAQNITTSMRDKFIEGRVEGFKNGFPTKKLIRYIGDVTDSVNNTFIIGSSGAPQLYGMTYAYLNKNKYNIEKIELFKNGSLKYTANPYLPIEEYLGQSFYFGQYPDEIRVKLGYNGKEGDEAFYIPSLSVKSSGNEQEIPTTAWSTPSSYTTANTPSNSTDGFKFDYNTRARMALNNFTGGASSFTVNMEFFYKPDAQVSIRFARHPEGGVEKPLGLLTISGVENVLAVENSDQKFTTLAKLTPYTQYSLRMEVTGANATVNGRGAYQLYLNDTPLLDSYKEFFQNGPYSPMYLEVYNEARARVIVDIIGE